MSQPYNSVGTADEILAVFGADGFGLDDADIIVAHIQSHGDYEEKAFVLFARNGVAHEVNASHCSCDSFFGQWEPEVVTPEALLMRKPSAFPSQPCYDAVRAWALANKKEKS